MFRTRFSRRNTLRAATLLVGSALLSGAAIPAPAQGGEYIVDGCHRADGSAAPMDGWRSLQTATHTVTVSNSCADGLAGAYGWTEATSAVPDTPGGSEFATGNSALVPVRAQLWLTVADGLAWNHFVSVPHQTGGSIVVSFLTTFGNDAQPLGSANLVTVTDGVLAGVPNARIGVLGACQELTVASGCFQPTWPTSRLKIYRSAITLADDTKPELQQMSGSAGLVAPELAPDVRGTVAVSATASDTGSGVRRLLLELDGKVVASGPAAGQSPTCNARLSGTTPAYDVRQPCPTSGTAKLIWDSTATSDGPHDIALYVEDAAGNRTVVTSGRTLVGNSGASASGSVPAASSGGAGAGPTPLRLAAGWPTTARKPSTNQADIRRCQRDAKYRAKPELTCTGRPASATLNARFDEHAVDHIGGLITDRSGSPIAGAAVATSTEWDAVGHAPPTLGSATTRSDGTFSIDVPRTLGSLDITVSTGAASLKLTRKVAAATTLVAPRRVKPATDVAFSGRLLSRTGNLARVPITLQARFGGQWHTFGSAQTTAAGEWKSRVRFARTRARYPVRAKVGRSVGYPWAAGLSTRTATVSVG